MIKLYVKKPVIVEAVLFSAHSGMTAKELANWCGGDIFASGDINTVQIIIPTLEGKMRAGYGDYIIRGIQGEFYPCKPAIFEATYEEIDPSRLSTLEKTYQQKSVERGLQ